MTHLPVRHSSRLDIMRPEQTLSETTSAVLKGLGPLIGALRPARILVHGYTMERNDQALHADYRR